MDCRSSKHRMIRWQTISAMFSMSPLSDESMRSTNHEQSWSCSLGGVDGTSPPAAMNCGWDSQSRTPEISSRRRTRSTLSCSRQRAWTICIPFSRTFLSLCQRVDLMFLTRGPKTSSVRPGRPKSRIARRAPEATNRTSSRDNPDSDPSAFVRASEATSCKRSSAMARSPRSMPAAGTSQPWLACSSAQSCRRSSHIIHLARCTIVRNMSPPMEVLTFEYRCDMTRSSHRAGTCNSGGVTLHEGTPSTDMGLMLECINRHT
mmetsp:Transcript_9159/g.24647  ORF Transcript_9159/g.24647 Transcript_9159/m.24647 type:complete len:261 (-) Transcript_9159:203-985(-)